MYNYYVFIYAIFDECQVETVIAWNITRPRNGFVSNRSQKKKKERTESLFQTGAGDRTLTGDPGESLPRRGRLRIVTRQRNRFVSNMSQKMKKRALFVPSLTGAGDRTLTGDPGESLPRRGRLRIVTRPRNRFVSNRSQEKKKREN